MQRPAPLNCNLPHLNLQFQLKFRVSIRRNRCVQKSPPSVRIYICNDVWSVCAHYQFQGELFSANENGPTDFDVFSVVKRRRKSASRKPNFLAKI